MLPGVLKSLGLSSKGTACSLFVHNREMKLFFWD